MLIELLEGDIVFKKSKTQAKNIKSVFFQEKKKFADPGKASGFSEIQRLIVRTPLELLIFFLIILARYMMKYQKVKIGKNFYCSKKNIWAKISIFIVAGPNLVRPTLLNLTDRTVWFINGVEELFFSWKKTDFSRVVK